MYNRCWRLQNFSANQKHNKKQQKLNKLESFLFYNSNNKQLLVLLVYVSIASFKCFNRRRNNRVQKHKTDRKLFGDILWRSCGWKIGKIAFKVSECTFLQYAVIKIYGKLLQFLKNRLQSPLDCLATICTYLIDFTFY